MEKRAIILAAGRGTRMEGLTESIHKCLLEVDGKKLIERQIERFLSQDIEKIGSLMVMQGHDGITISSALLGVGKRIMTSQLGHKDTKKAIERLAKFPDYSLINGNYTIH